MNPWALGPDVSRLHRPSETRSHPHLLQVLTWARSCSSSWVENSVRQWRGTSISATISPILRCMASHSSADRNPSSTRNPSSWNYRQTGRRLRLPSTLKRPTWGLIWPLPKPEAVWRQDLASRSLLCPHPWPWCLCPVKGSECWLLEWRGVEAELSHCNPPVGFSHIGIQPHSFTQPPLTVRLPCTRHGFRSCRFSHEQAIHDACLPKPGLRKEIDIQQTSIQGNLLHKVCFISLEYNTGDRKIFTDMGICSRYSMRLEKKSQGTFLVVQWLRLPAPNAGGPRFNLWSGN